MIFKNDMLGCSQSSGRLQCIKSKMLHGSRASSLQKSYTALLLETLRFGQILCIGKRNAYKQQVLSQRSILMWFFMGLLDFPEKDAFISYYQVCIPGCQLFFFFLPQLQNGVKVLTILYVGLITLISVQHSPCQLICWVP